MASYNLTNISEDTEKAMAPHSSTLAWKIPWRKEPDGLHPRGCRESDMSD